MDIALTVLLAKVLGLYMIFVGVAILMNRRHFMLAVAALLEERAAQIIGGIVALLFGLFMVNIHNDWTSLPASIVTLIGWLSLLKGLFYLFASEATVGKMVKMFNQRKWYMVDGIIAVLIGLYLAGTAFGYL